MSDEREALLGLGGNLGDRLATLRSAVSLLESTPSVTVVGCSGVYESPPLGPVAQPDFLNAAVLVRTTLAPRELLAVAHSIEQQHGRERRVRWGPRTLDIDLLWVDGVTIDEPGLTIPHPGLVNRAFVLRPAAELKPELRLPGGLTVADLTEGLVDDACILLQGAELRG